MKRGARRIVLNSYDRNLDRFAGSSDEENEEKPKAIPPPGMTPINSCSNDEEESDADEDIIGSGFRRDEKNLDDEERNRNVGKDENDDLSSVEEESDTATKMANVMNRILGINSKNKNEKDAVSTSVVLAKTVTPLQKLQQKEKERQKAMKEKRQANRERNLTALHLPLSIATTNNIEARGQLSVAKELEQERFHRRVATRGVVALFNAITQHQRNNSTDNEDSNVSSKKTEISKLTKHGFLDKIKAAAKTKGNDEQKETEFSKRGKNITSNEGSNRSSWGALQDDYMLSSKRNWDEESSAEEESVVESNILKSRVQGDTKGSISRKKRRNNQEVE